MADVLQAGNAGLARSIQLYDVDRFGELSTYAWHWIAQAIRTCLNRQRYKVPVPRSISARLAKYRRASRRVVSRNDWFELWADGMQDHPVRFPRVLRMNALCTPLPLQLASDCTNDAQDPSQRLEQEEQSKLVRRCLANLTERDRHVLIARYGLDGRVPRMLTDVSSELDLSKERIRQIQLEAQSRFAELWACDGRLREELPLGSSLPPPPSVPRTMLAAVTLSAPATGNAWASTRPAWAVRPPWRSSSMVQAELPFERAFPAATRSLVTAMPRSPVPSHPRPMPLVEKLPGEVKNSDHEGAPLRTLQGANGDRMVRPGSPSNLSASAPPAVLVRLREPLAETDAPSVDVSPTFIHLSRELATSDRKDDLPSTAPVAALAHAIEPCPEAREVQRPQSIRKMRPKPCSDLTKLPPLKPRRFTPCELPILEPYEAWTVVSLADPIHASDNAVLAGIRSIVAVEGPVLCERVYRLFVLACGESGVTRRLKRRLNQIMHMTIERGVLVQTAGYDEPFQANTFVRLRGTPHVRPRSLGPRSFREVEPAELLATLKEIRAARPSRQRSNLLAEFALPLNVLGELLPHRASGNADSPLVEESERVEWSTIAVGLRRAHRGGLAVEDSGR